MIYINLFSSRKDEWTIPDLLKYYKKGGEGLLVKKMQEAKFNAEEIQKCVHIATALTLRQKMEELSNSMGEDEEETPDIIKKEKAKTKAFSGSGYKLSSTSEESLRTSSPLPILPPTDIPTPKQIVVVDPDQPKTQIQFRLPDGSRFIAQFNTTHTINDIRNHLNAIKPLTSPTATYELIIPTPRKVLSNLSNTIQQEGLLNATIVQTLK